MSDTTPPTDRSWMDRKLEETGRRLQSPEGRRQLVGGCLRLVQRVVSGTTVTYVLALLLLGALMRYVGERNMFFAFCLYLPPLLWYLPALVLLPLCLLVGAWRTLLVSCLCVALSVSVFFGYKLGSHEPVAMVAPPTRLVVLTNNRGQNAGQSLKPFKNLVKPDVMVFQEAGGTASRYLADPAYGEFKDGRDVAGEFSLVSRYPIVSGDPVTLTVAAVPRSVYEPTTATETYTIAARYVLDVNGTHVVVYNVHMPTPRDTLRYYQRGVFLYGLIGLPGTPFAAKRVANQKGWDQRMELVLKLLERARQETGPTLLVGDFNMPSTGWSYQQVLKDFAEAHAEAGSGFGFTFPGVTRNPLSFGGAWMRIDHLFFDREHWYCHQGITEPDRASQHRAAAAVLDLKASTQFKAAP